MIPDRYRIRQDGFAPLREGYFLIHRDRAERTDIPVRVWFGPPADPQTGEILDRPWRWHMQIGLTLLDDEPISVGGIYFSEFSEIWPGCAKHEIDREDYEYRIARASWASDWDPEDPHGEVGGRIDPMTCPLP